MTQRSHYHRSQQPGPRVIALVTVCSRRKDEHEQTWTVELAMICKALNQTSCLSLPFRNHHVSFQSKGYEDGISEFATRALNPHAHGGEGDTTQSTRPVASSDFSVVSRARATSAVSTNPFLNSVHYYDYCDLPRLLLTPPKMMIDDCCT